MRLRDQNTDLLFKALADSTRRDILIALRRQDMPVHELTALFDISRPAISKHLVILGEAGLVTATRQGKENIYSLQEDAMRDLSTWLDRFWGGRLQLLKQLAERRH